MTCFHPCWWTGTLFPAFVWPPKLLRSCAGVWFCFSSSRTAERGFPPSCPGLALLPGWPLSEAHKPVYSPLALEFMHVWHQKSWTFQINSTGKESGCACFPGRDTFSVQAAAAATLPLNHFFLSKGVFQPAASPGQAGLCLRLCDNILSTGSGPFSAVLPGCGEISRDGNSRFRLRPLLAL